MAKPKLTPFARFFLAALVMGGLFGLFKVAQSNGWMDMIAPQKASSEGPAPKLNRKERKDVIKIGVVTWGGYAGGQYFNNGFRASKDSRFFQEYGILVDFVVIDDFAASRAAWKADEVNLMWITADAFPTEVGSLSEYDPKILFQADWSRGGDAIVARKGIGSVADLRGKKVAVAFGTPSHTFLLWMLEAGNMTNRDVQVVEVASAVDAAAMFKSGQVDAAVVWSPDDEDCVVKIPGSRILRSTREATHIIADVFYAKSKYIEQNEEALRGLVEGWMRGAAEVNTSSEAKQRAAEILSAGLNMDVSFCLKAINNVRLCTYGDNKGFFQIQGCNTCVSGEQLYTKMSQTYTDVGLIKGPVPNWRNVTYTNILRALTLSGVEHQAEEMFQFAKATTQEESAPAFSNKAVSIKFAVGSAELDDNAKYIIDTEFSAIAKAFGNARVRIEGNTDITGSLQVNKALSYRRAQSVANYLSSAYHFDPNRFVIIGNGSDKPVASNDTEEGRAKNRRTDFQLLN